MNNLLDAIVNDHGSRPVVNPVNVGNNGASDTSKAVEMFGRALPFRGLLRDVRGKDNGALLADAGLAWKVHTMPVGVIGKTETRKADGYQALVRGDTGGLLSITTDSFKAHQNSDIIGDMQAMAAAGDAEVCFAGALDGGRKVVAIAKLEGEFELPDKHQNTYRNDHAGAGFSDKTYLFAVISGGHEVGTPFKIRGMGFRRWCGNGAFFTINSASTYTRSHRMAIDAVRLKIAATYDSIRREFGGYAEQARRLQAVQMEKEQSRLFVAELLKPGIAVTLAERLKRLPSEQTMSYSDVWVEVADTLRGKQVLDSLIAENDAIGAAGFARHGKTLLDAIVNQDGANGENLWSAYNGVTWHVDHKRGRNDESGMDAALFGAGAALKQQALETAMRFV